ncbi:GNAT family N-acetyltransferase [Tenacibaculum sp. 190524A05c]|uniref:Acetyltransf_6 domain-containing protein n=1 Tax=Tenacibaculum platacis TaxID=3137852 RepID=A0ABM9P4F3_9FLAO
MLDIYKLDTQEGIEKYNSLLANFDIIEPYFLIDAIDVFGEGYENLMFFLYENTQTGAFIFMPGYLKPVIIRDEETPYFDFTTPYGYTGPYFSKEVVEIDIIEFWNNVDTWYRNNNVVCEFIRFNLSNNHLHYSGICKKTMLNIKGKILDEETQWSSFDRKVRKNVNKAKREGLYSHIYYENVKDENIVEFFEIYRSTMVRTKAKESFFYSIEKFKKFIKENPLNCAVCTVYFEGTPISSELVLISKDSIYSFLGGTNEKYFDKRPNDFLKVELIHWARNNNIQFYILGGGYGFEDGIFKYKKAFFPNDIVNYYTGRKIIDKSVYSGLLEKTNAYRVSKGLLELDIKDESFFPLYKKMN